MAGADRRVSSLRKFQNETDLVGATAKHWRWIWTEINYVAIFQLGERILNELPSSGHTRSAVKALLAEAISICNQQTALRHDLMGRIYHWLLHNAKEYATYYTSVSAATLLMKLVMASSWKADFGDPASLASFKVADLACGTGTLLMAAAQAITDTYIIRRMETGESLDAADLSTLHRTLMENVLHGYDVLPTAVHLTASTLAMLAPEVAFVRMALYVMPLGMDRKKARLGSLDFLQSSEVQTQMALDHSQIETTRTGVSTSYASKATVPKLDLCVMNPPFSRSVGGNLLFGSLPDDERAKLQTELKHQVSSIGASATAGLGSVFVALADQLLKPGGRLAFVVPAAIASGEAWGESRKLIADRYHLEAVISSYDAERPNFSENTDLSEVLFIARKLKSREKPGPTKYINLWRNPHSIHDAIDLANRIEHAVKVASVTDRGFTSIPGATEKLGEIVSVPATKDESIWIGALFAQTELLRICWHLNTGNLVVPSGEGSTSIPLCPLEELGAIGPDRKRIHEGFKVSKNDWSPYPGFWGHDYKAVQTIHQVPNARLIPWLESPRGPNYGAHLWKRAGSIQLVERLWPITHRVIAIGLDEQALGNTWWALKPTARFVPPSRKLCSYG